MGKLKLKSKHRLLCGDSTSEADVARLMDGNKADMCFTDPPYGVGYEGMKSSMYGTGGRSGKSRKRLQNDDSTDIYGRALPIICQHCNGVTYLFCGAGHERCVLNHIHENKMTVSNTMVWKKDGGFGALGANYKPIFELFYYLAPKKGGRGFVGASNETTMWEISKVFNNKLHPTQKPVALAVRAISNHTAKTVLDLFLGSGSTLIACEQLNRRCYGMEIDPLYCDVVVKRWENITGGKAVCNG